MASVVMRGEMPRPPGSDRMTAFDVEALAHAVSCGFRDLSHDLQLLGDYPDSRGLNATIWQGMLSRNTRVAVKLIDAPPSSLHRREFIREFIREAEIWSHGMNHENVIPLLGVARLRGSVAFISPWMEEGNLGRYLKNHPDANPEGLFADAARALAYLHSQGIVYGIPQPATILVSDTGRAYLCSFAFAHHMHESVDTPEDDVFRFGTTVIESLADRAVNARAMAMFINEAFKGKVRKRPNFLKGLTDGLWSIVQACWEENKRRIPTMSEVARRMAALAETSSPPSDATQSNTARTLKNISAEVKRLDEHPITGGGFYDLYRGEWLGSEIVALKLARLFGSTDKEKDAARHRLLSEARLWAEFQHPRILEFYGICDYGDHALFMVSPFLKNGNIMNYLQSVDPHADRHRLLTEAAEGLLYLHSRNIVHGDLKGANILVTDSRSAVLADFGLAKISHEVTTSRLQDSGSPWWMAPELLMTGDNPSGPRKTHKSDVYAFGHVMLEVLSNKLPFPDLKAPIHVIMETMRGGRSPRPDGPVAEKWLNDAAWAISRRCTAVDPIERPGIETVVSDLGRLRAVVGEHAGIRY